MDKVELIQLPKIQDPRGDLFYFENSNQIPSKIKRRIGLTICMEKSSELVMYLRSLMN